MIATDVHRRFCLELAKQYPYYSDDLWLISRSHFTKWIRELWGGPPSMGSHRRHHSPQLRWIAPLFLPQPRSCALSWTIRFFHCYLDSYGFVNALTVLGRFQPTSGSYQFFCGLKALTKP